jgi:hypothetical protein
MTMTKKMADYKIQDLDATGHPVQMVALARLRRPIMEYGPREEIESTWRLKVRENVGWDLAENAKVVRISKSSFFRLRRKYPALLRAHETVKIDGCFH